MLPIGVSLDRVPGEYRIYATRIDLEKLTTKFEDWIEEDLLKLNSWDVEKVALKNYEVIRDLSGAALDRKFDRSISRRKIGS